AAYNYVISPTNEKDSRLWKSWLAQILPYVEQDALAKATEATNNGALPPPQYTGYSSYPQARMWYPWDRSGRFLALRTPLSIYKCTSDPRTDLAALVAGTPGQTPDLVVAFTGYLGINGPDNYAWSLLPDLSFYQREAPGILVATNKSTGTSGRDAM